MTPKAFHDEVVARFPEVACRLSEGDEELSYLVAGAIADWLASVARPRIAPEIISRVRSFYDWAHQQPRGKTASDDAVTIVTVGFLENLFERDELLPLIPHLTTRAAMLANRDYLHQWVGPDRYEKALRLYG